MTNALFTTAEVAAELRCSSRTVRRKASRLGVGIDLGGPAGFRYTRGDIDAILASLRPAPAPARRRHRRAS